MSIYSLAVSKIILAAIIWGLSFTLVRWSLESFSTAQLLIWRLLFAYLIGEALLFIFNRKIFYASHSDIKSAKYVGIALGLSLLFQIHGLNYTTATKSAFITTTYVVMIPFFAYILLKHSLQVRDLFLALLAAVGMLFLLDLLGSSGFSIKDLNYGDMLTVFCAATAAIQIMLIGVHAKNSVSAFRFNNFQNLWSFLTIIPFLFYEMNYKQTSLWPAEVTQKALLGLLALTLLVSVLAFYLQVSGQRTVSITTAGMLCLLEAPFSFFFATLLLSETISLSQAAGAGLILLSAFLSTYFGKKL